MEILRAELDKLLTKLDDAEQIKARLETLISVYPFNEFEYLISTLLGRGTLALNDYYMLRVEYIARNLYLPLYEINAPRTFGEDWAEGHVQELVPDLVRPAKKDEPEYDRQYDFLLDEKTRVEVKASRAVAFRMKGSLANKALPLNSDKKFDMNFQQLKPAYCDVFVWIGVWRDAIKYWVLAAREVQSNRYYSGFQHRGNTGEGQLHIKKGNVATFATFEVPSTGLRQAIVDAYQRQTTTSQ